MTFDRWHAGAVFALALLAASAYWAGAVELRGPNLLVRVPGAVIPIFHEARCTGTAADGCVVLVERGLPGAPSVHVRNLGEQVLPGESVTVVGIFEPPDHVRALEHRVHHTRFVKVWVSLPPLAWLAWGLARRWRPTWAGLEVRDA